MKTQKVLAWILLAGLLAISGCFGKTVGENYIITVYDEDPNFNVVEMQTFDPESRFFTFRYDTNVWELQEWNEWDAPNIVALVHKELDSTDASTRCAVLPGTIGMGPIEGGKVLEGSLITMRYMATTLDIYDADGVWVKHVVGYEVEGFPYIFEVQLPNVDTDNKCFEDSQALVSSFYVEQEEEVTEESGEEVQPVEESTETSEDGSVEAPAVEEEVTDTSDTTSVPS